MVLQVFLSIVLRQAHRIDALVMPSARTPRTLFCGIPQLFNPMLHEVLFSQSLLKNLRTFVRSERVTFLPLALSIYVTLQILNRSYSMPGVSAPLHLRTPAASSITCQESYFVTRSPKVRAPPPVMTNGKKPKKLRKKNKSAKYLSQIRYKLGPRPKDFANLVT